MPNEPAGPSRPPLSGLSAAGPGAPGAGVGPADDQASREARDRMVDEQIASRGVREPAIVAALRQVPRHLFVPADLRASAYADFPLPIGHGQTISQPFIVALMTELARPSPAARALEVGAGSGYQAAVLSRLVAHVFTLEVDADLAGQAADRLRGLGYANVTVRRADGYGGLPAESPFDIVLVTAAPEKVPRALLDQLAPGGRLVIPVGPRYQQQLQVVEKLADGTTKTRTVAPVVFVPMVHAAID